MARVEFDVERCKGCLLCVEVCPKHCISKGKYMNKQGYNVAIIEDMSLCTGCASCGLICPDAAIKVYR